MWVCECVCVCLYTSLRAINHTFSQQVLAYMTVHVFVYDCAGLYRYLWKNFGHQINTSILNTQYHRRLSQRPILATTAWSRVFTKMGTSAQHENVNESFSSKYFCWAWKSPMWNRLWVIVVVKATRNLTHRNLTDSIHYSIENHSNRNTRNNI